MENTMLTKITEATTNVVFLANATISQRSCACGKVRSVNARSARAFMGGCDPFRREPCADCGCQVDAAKPASAGVALGDSVDARCYADDDCSVCGAIADTFIRQPQDGCAVRVPICLDCANVMATL